MEKPDDMQQRLQAAVQRISLALIQEEAEKRAREQRICCSHIIALRRRGLFDSANAVEEVRYRNENRYPSDVYSTSLARDIHVGSEQLYRLMGNFDKADYCRQYVDFVDSNFIHLPPLEVS